VKLFLNPDVIMPLSFALLLLTVGIFCSIGYVRAICGIGAAINLTATVLAAMAYDSAK